MKCPIDGETLLMTQRAGVEIDYCPKCRGVWLDRGELDKILEREADDDDDRDDYQRRGSQPNQSAQYNSDYRGQENRGYDSRYNEPRRDSEVKPLEIIKDVLASQSSHKRDDYRYGHKKKKKGGLLGELFDF